MIFVFDMEDFGYSHFYLEPVRQVLHIMQAVFVNCTARFIVVNPNYTTRFLFAAIKPFLNERARDKSEFLSDLSIETLEASCLLRQYLPAQWGGEV